MQCTRLPLRVQRNLVSAIQTICFPFWLRIGNCLITLKRSTLALVCPFLLDASVRHLFSGGCHCPKEMLVNLTPKKRAIDVTGFSERAKTQSRNQHS
jgi:hypothetical protein